MSEQFKDNVLGCFVCLFAMATMLFGVNLLLIQIQEGWLVLILGVVLFMLPLTWTRNISYDKEGNEVLSSTMLEDLWKAIKENWL